MTRPRRQVPGAQQEALFGAPSVTDRPPAATGNRTSVQDPEVVASVVRAADAVGFLVVERGGRVVQVDPARPGVVDSAAGHEQEAVHQLLDAGLLRLGGAQHVHHHGQEGPARTVTVPKGTRDMVTRWSNLRPLPRQRTGPPGRARRQVSGRISVDVVEQGKALVLIRTPANKSVGGTIGRERDPNRPPGRAGYYVENDDGQVLGTVASFRAGAEKLARHYGYRPGPIEIEHEHRHNQY